MKPNRDHLEAERDDSSARCRALWSAAFLTSLVNRDEQAWDQLKGCYGPYLYRLALSQLASHADAEDVVQESIIGFLHHVKKGSVRSAHALLVRIFSNKVVDVIRDRVRERKHVSPLPRDSDLPAPGEEVTEELDAELMAVAEPLPGPDRELFRLRFVECLSDQEIADRFKVKKGAVTQRVCRLRAALRESMKSG